MMEDDRPNRGTPLVVRKEALLAVWLTRTLETYPAVSRDFLTGEKDPFRNPVGHTLRERLASLLEGLLGAQEVTDLVPALEPIVRLRAVQDFTPGQALSFLFLLKDVAREEMARLGESASTETERLEARIDRLALAAFDLYVKCREEICTIQVNEAKRSMFVQLRRAKGSGRMRDEA
jgi:RsbT co-antagonist protein rsbRD N-terminal domain